MIRQLTHIIPIIVYGLLVGITPASSLFAQTKIGYVDMQAVMMRMPETKAMQDKLDIYQRQLAANLKARSSCWYPGGFDSALLQLYKEELHEELQALQMERDQYALAAEQKIIQKREELLAPILAKIQLAIQKIATEKGYTYVLNLNSAILSEGLVSLATFNSKHNLTADVLEELGID